MAYHAAALSITMLMVLAQGADANLVKAQDLLHR